MEIYVYADWEDIDGPELMGSLHVSRTKGHSVIAFQYDTNWIKKGQAQILDPDLQLYTGPQYPGKNKPNFGVFSDSSPDRWGKELMRRRESILARQEKRKAKVLFEEDYLLGVYDLHRMGGLRFKTDIKGDFLHDDKGLAAPPWTSLRKLENASKQLENDMLKDPEALKWINLLIAPGASLGGARPKASVTDEGGALWIAKFPSIKDNTDVGAWEMIASEMGAAAGIKIAHGMIRKFNSKHHTFLSKRFDRTESGARIHFASAMTLLGKTDGADGTTGVSYLDLAEFIIQNSAAANADLKELWRRIVFSIAIKNTDDHLRNHGFILTKDGWRLAPAYDVNPIYFGSGLSLNISEDDNSLDFELALEVAKFFRVSIKEGKTIIDKTKKVVSNWSEKAEKYNISRYEQEVMEGAFDLVK